MATAKSAGSTKPIAFTLPGCPSCDRLKNDWAKYGVAFDERGAKRDQSIVAQACECGDLVPSVLFPDGRVEVVYKDMIG